MNNIDEKILKLRAERARAHMRLEIIRKGLAAVLADEYHEADDLKPVIDMVNTELADAISVAFRADKAMEPYFRRARIRRQRAWTVRPRTKRRKVTVKPS